MVGAAVSVRGPWFAAAIPVVLLVTVIVPFLTVVLAVPVVSAGVGPANAAAPPVTVKPAVLLVPPVVVTLRFLTPSVAALPRVSVAVAEVPAPFTVRAPKVMFGIARVPVDQAAPARLVPVRVIGTVAPRTPDVGAIAVNVGAATPAVTVKLTMLLGPPGAVTVTFRAPRVAVAEMLKVAVTVVALTAVNPLTAMPVPDTVIAVGSGQTRCRLSLWEAAIPRMAVFGRSR